VGCNLWSVLYNYNVYFFFFFFFQAEDGIRDLTVTGVQTCALPISAVSRAAERSIIDASGDPAVRHAFWLLTQIPLAARQTEFERSEERRVGKECRSRWLAYH